MTDTDIRIEIKTVADKAIKDVSKLTKEIDRMNKRIANGGRASVGEVGQMTRSFKSLTAHVSKLALIYGSFKSLMSGTVITAQFEQSIQKLGIYSGATTTELEALETQAKELGETTVFSASQVAEGMNEMALAGLSSEDMLAGIGDTLNLASVGMLSLKEATDYTVTSMKTYGLKATDMNNITDIFAKGSTISATTVTQLGQALTKVGAVASTYNVSLEETTALLGVLADGGRRASEAGTQLKISMLRLASNPEAKKYLDKLGISMYGLETQTDGTIKKALLPFTEQLRIVRDALKELDAESRNEAMARIFGTEAVATAQILMDNLEEVHSKLAKIKDAMENDFATTSAKLMMDTLVGSFKNLMSALEGLAIKIVGEMTPAIREMLDVWTETIRGMDSDSLKDVSDGLSWMISVLGDITSVLGSVGGAMMGFSSANKELVKTLGTLGIALLIIRRNALMTNTALITLASNPYFLLLMAGIITIDLTVDALNAQNKALKEVGKTLRETADRQEAYTTKLENAWQSNTEELGKNNFEKRILIKQTEEEIKAVKKEIQAVVESRTIGDKKTAQTKKLWEEYYRLKAIIDKIVGSFKKETEEEKKATDAKIKTYEATEKAKENHEKYAKALDKVIASVEKSYSKEGKALNKLKLSHAKLRKEMLDNEKKYADDVKQIEEDYEQLKYDANTKNLSEHKKYLSDKARATELAEKAEEAFGAGRLAEASRYYAEAKALAQGFAGSIIKENDVILASEKETRQEALEIYKVTQAGEKKLLAEKRKAEKEANIAKLEFMEFEMDAMIHQLEIQALMLKALKDYKTEAKKSVNAFDDDGYMQDKLKELKDFRDGFKEYSAKLKIKLEKDSFNNDMKQVEDSVNRLNAKPIEIDTSVKTDGSNSIDKAIEKTYHLESELQTIDSKEVYVMVMVEDDPVEEAKEKLKDLEYDANNPLIQVIDTEASKIDEAKEKIKDLKVKAGDKITINFDTGEVSKVDDIKSKLDRLTIGEYTVKIGADTTPADFDIPEYIQTVTENKSGDIKFGANVTELEAELNLKKEELKNNKTNIPMLAKLEIEEMELKLAEMKESSKYSIKTTLNPDWVKAEKDIEAFRKKEEKKPIKKPLKVDTTTAKKDIDTIEPHAKSKKPETTPLKTRVDQAKGEVTQFVNWASNQNALVMVNADSTQAYRNVRLLVDWINNQTATIKVYTQQMNASGGLIMPQGLADGGIFTGSGRVGGYDPTDSDKVSAKLTGGEFVVKREAVDSYGLSLLHAINSMRFETPRGYALGGEVGGSDMASRNISLNFIDDQGSSMSTVTDEQTADRIGNYLRKFAR